MAAITIHTVDPDHDNHIVEFREMTRAYLEWLGVSLDFQGIERELASLPGSYHPNNRGCMLLAFEQPYKDGETPVCIGAVALRPLTGQHLDDLKTVGGFSISDICEMKRLFVLPSHQGQGAGTKLTAAVLEAAKGLGYKAMVLDTLDRLSGANRLYKAQGFELCERYNDCPLDGVLYFIRKLE